MTFLRRFWDAAVVLDPAAIEHDEGRSMRYESYEDLWEPLESGLGPAGAYVETLDDQRRTALKAELRSRLDAGDEPFELSARAWAVTGTVSAAAPPL